MSERTAASLTAPLHLNVVPLSRAPTMRGASTRRDSVSARSRRQTARVCVLLAGVAAAAGLAGYLLGTDRVPWRHHPAASSVADYSAGAGLCICSSASPNHLTLHAAHDDQCGACRVQQPVPSQSASCTPGLAAAKVSCASNNWAPVPPIGCRIWHCFIDTALAQSYKHACFNVTVLTAGAVAQGSQWHRQGVPKWSWGMGEAAAEEQPKVKSDEVFVILVACTLFIWSFHAVAAKSIQISIILES
jgi:hypothetical protein